MNRVFVLLLLMLFVGGTALAGEVQRDESACPAHQAAEQGHNVFDVFHGIMAPAWHNAWPAKDYEALLEVGPKFKEVFADVAAMKPEFKSPTKAARFEEKRNEFGKIVAEYAAAAEAGNKDKVYELMPSLHEAFEETAACLVPTDFKQLQALATVSGMIMNKHLPENNTEGIVGSTETLVNQVDALNAEVIPSDLEYFKKGLLRQFEVLKAEANEAKTCCDKKDMDNYKKHMMAFNSLVNEMIAQYL